MTLRLLAALAVLTAGAPAALAAEPFRDCPDCPQMIPLPGGTVSVGDVRVRNAAPPPDGALRHVAPFAIARTETTFDQWQACVDAGACEGGQDDHGWGRGDRPVINVTADDARAYAAWLSRRTGHAYRLPTEAEWEYAARAGSRTLYPWGDAVQDGRANCRDCDGPVVEHGGTTPVASYPPNAFGLHDMNGNLWELTADCWTPGAMPATPPAPGGTEECKAHVMRGGAWYYHPRVAASASRGRNAAGVWSYVVGFRVARDLENGAGDAAR
ncbi:formylglycine-generating enzyme family protein [Caenispirillum salinarum]|uniref:formylglycine-generating enzyme family protein n=1 Tax=Caenispirillum salinarum TaxID=859058 RepID=UPI00384AE91C